MKNMIANFVLSNGRSGSLFLAKVLSLSKQLRVLHEGEPDFSDDSYFLHQKSLGYESTYLEFREEDIRKANEARRVFVEINGNLTLILQPLLPRFSSPKLLIITRNVYDYIISCRARGVYTVADEVQCNRWIPAKDDPFFRQWSKLSQVEKIAWYWKEYMMAHLRYAKKNLAETSIVKFEDMVSRPEVLYDVCMFLGADDIKIKQLQNIQGEKINATPLEKMKKDIMNFDRINAISGELLKDLGYPLTPMR